MEYGVTNKGFVIKPFEKTQRNCVNFRLFCHGEARLRIFYEKPFDRVKPAEYDYLKKMHFEKIEIEDYKKITGYLKLSDTRLCDFTVGSLFMWGDFFANGFCITDDALIISGKDLDGLFSFTPPFCTKDNERDVLKKLYEHAKREYGYLKLYPVTESKVEHYRRLLEEISGTACSAARMEDWYDYIYDAEELITLSGKKYHGQRNHINRFLRDNAAFSFERIDGHNIEAAFRFAGGVAAEASVCGRLEAYESMSVLTVLQNYGALGQEGYLLSINGNPVGLALGEVEGDTLYEHVEKADKNIPGIFPFLSNQYIKTMKERFPSFTFVNREEDLGDLGIRYAKECYHPAWKIYKYYLYV